MLDDYEDLLVPRPFWFVSEDLLISFWHIELNAITQAFAEWPDLRKLFDAPEATVPQRIACFKLLAHRKVVETIDEAFLERYTQAPTLSNEESSALVRSQNLVAADAPAWVQEIGQVVELLPTRIHRALPKPLRDEIGYITDPARGEAVRSATKTLSSVDQIQALTGKVVEEQLQRLEGRWSAGISTFQTPPSQVTKTNRAKGAEGLVRKNDLSRYSLYMDKLTEKQKLAFVLRFEYGLGLSEIATRMEINRKTADEHIKAAQKKVEQARSSEKRKVRRAKNMPEF